LTNAAVEGDTASDATIGVTTRVGNKCQISQKTVKISGTLEAVDKAGRKSEKAYQLAKASAEIKRDMETTLLSNQASTNGNSSTARKLGGLQTWLATNGDFGTSGVAGASGTTTRTNGTNRTFDEATLKTVVKEVYASGGNPKVLMVNPAHKQLVSAFTGIAAQRFFNHSFQSGFVKGAVRAVGTSSRAACASNTACAEVTVSRQPCLQTTQFTSSA